MPIDPWASEDALRFLLLKLKEDQELDALVKSNMRDILGHKIAISPSKGRYDEKGKDIVATKIEKARIERELDGDYCSVRSIGGILKK